MKLDLNIIEVENGYIVAVYPHGRNGARGKEFVAHTCAALGQLVTDLAVDASRSEEAPGHGPVQEPKA